MFTTETMQLSSQELNEALLNQLKGLSKQEFIELMTFNFIKKTGMQNRFFLFFTFSIWKFYYYSDWIDIALKISNDVSVILKFIGFTQHYLNTNFIDFYLAEESIGISEKMHIKHVCFDKETDKLLTGYTVLQRSSYQLDSWGLRNEDFDEIALRLAKEKEEFNNINK